MQCIKTFSLNYCISSTSIQREGARLTVYHASSGTFKPFSLSLHMFVSINRMLIIAVFLGMPKRWHVTTRPRVLIVELAYILTTVLHLSTCSSGIQLNLGSRWSKSANAKHCKRHRRNDMNYCTVPLMVQQCVPSRDARAFLDVQR